MAGVERLDFLNSSINLASGIAASTTLQEQQVSSYFSIEFPATRGPGAVSPLDSGNNLGFTSVTYPDQNLSERLPKNADFGGGQDILVVLFESSQVNLVSSNGAWLMLGNGFSRTFQGLEYIQFLDKAVSLNPDGTTSDILWKPYKTPAPTVNISALSAGKKEGNKGTTPFTFRLTRSGDLSKASSVRYDVQGLGAGRNRASASDFAGKRFPSGSVSFQAGEASKVLTLRVRGDRTVERSEGFSIKLSNPSNAQLSTSSATGLIRNDDRKQRGSQRSSRQARLSELSSDHITGRTSSQELLNESAQRRSRRDPLTNSAAGDSATDNSITTTSALTSKPTTIGAIDLVDFADSSPLMSTSPFATKNNEGLLATNPFGAAPDSASL